MRRELQSLLLEVSSDVKPVDRSILLLSFGLGGRRCSPEEIAELSGMEVHIIKAMRDRAVRNIRQRYSLLLQPYLYVL